MEKMEKEEELVGGGEGGRGGGNIGGKDGGGIGGMLEESPTYLRSSKWKSSKLRRHIGGSCSGEMNEWGMGNGKREIWENRK